MTTDRAIRVLAGVFVLASLALGHWVNPWWHLLAVFVALNLIQSAFTGFCPPEMLMRKLGMRSCTCGKTAGEQASCGCGH